MRQLHWVKSGQPIVKAQLRTRSTWQFVIFCTLLVCLQGCNLGIFQIEWWFHCDSSVLYKSITRWWFGTLFNFPYICNNHPNWLHIFQRGRLNHQSVIFWGYHESDPQKIYVLTRQWNDGEQGFVSPDVLISYWWTETMYIYIYMYECICMCIHVYNVSLEIKLHILCKCFFTYFTIFVQYLYMMIYTYTHTTYTLLRDLRVRLLYPRIYSERSFYLERKFLSRFVIRFSISVLLGV